MYDNSQELISNPRWSLIVVDMCCYNFSFEILLWLYTIAVDMCCYNFSFEILLWLYTIANWFENCLI